MLLRPKINPSFSSRVVFIKVCVAKDNQLPAGKRKLSRTGDVVTHSMRQLRLGGLRLRTACAKLKERSQRRLRPGKAVSGPTTSLATTKIGRASCRERV